MYHRLRPSRGESDWRPTEQVLETRMNAVAAACDADERVTRLAVRYTADASLGPDDVRDVLRATGRRWRTHPGDKSRITTVATATGTVSAGVLVWRPGRVFRPGHGLITWIEHRGLRAAWSDHRAHPDDRAPADRDTLAAAVEVVLDVLDAAAIAFDDPNVLTSAS